MNATETIIPLICQDFEPARNKMLKIRELNGKLNSKLNSKLLIAVARYVNLQFGG
jgi:hypothetical protein